ncbi:MAG: methyltransferase domain-containing protein, partial [Lachnospiraceae bacterium]|nr:methyltransferase domain-containing protein [Lachnospiraceae bacterium]
MNIPFWEESYLNDSTSTFGVEPNATILDYEHLFQKWWQILDIGCGDGKNSLYLSSKGFQNIDAFDFSENAIAKFMRISHKKELSVNAWVQDLRRFQFEKAYDLVFSFGTLHFVDKADWKSLLQKAKENTNIGGIHIIQLFTNSIPATPDIAPFAVGLADDEEIKESYQDWNILQFKSYSFEDEHPGVPK